MILLNAAAASTFIAPLGNPYNYLIHKAGDYNYMDWVRSGRNEIEVVQLRVR